MGAVKYLEIREGSNIFEGSWGDTNTFELLYLKYMCEYYMEEATCCT